MTILNAINAKKLITKNTALVFIIALYFLVFHFTFDLLKHNLMPVTLLFTTYITWLYGRTYGLSGIAFFTAAHALLLLCTNKPSLTSLFDKNPILYFGVFTQIILVFLVDYFKHIYNQLKAIKNQLEIANTRAEEADKIKNSFMADLSHEIRNPLCSIIGYAELLKDDDNLSQQQICMLEPIISNSQHLLLLINKVLDFSKIENESIDIQDIEFDLSALIAEICSSIRFMASKKGLEFNHKLIGDFNNMIISDPLRLRQILINLISNSIKFTDTGGVTLECEKKSGAGDYSNIIFRVIDTGPGLNETEINKLFMPYKQASTQTERNYGGTGLGLVIAGRLVRLLGGASIKVESVKNSRTTFYFELKIKNGKPVEIKKLPTGSAPVIIPVPHNSKTGKHYKILVAEDNLFNLALIKNILEARSYEVIEASDGKIALQAALNENPDLILLDVQIPEINGIEVTRMLREAGRLTPIISITGDNSEAMARDCINAGMNGLLSKPFRPEEIYRIVEQHLE
jgi:signal transduction histidine kinase